MDPNQLQSKLQRYSEVLGWRASGVTPLSLQNLVHYEFEYERNQFIVMRS